MFFNKNRHEESLNLDKLTNGSGKCFNTLMNISLNTEIIKFRSEKNNFYGKAFIFIRDSKTKEFLSASNFSNVNVTIAMDDYGNDKTSSCFPLFCGERKILCHLNGNGEIRLSNGEIQTQFRFWSAFVGTSDNLKNKSFDNENVIDGIFDREQVLDYLASFFPKDILEEFSNRAYPEVENIELPSVSQH